jgi:hypothetical protein
MDEDFYGNAVGSYSPASKTVVAKQALRNVVSALQDKANVGIMTYGLPGDVGKMQIHNAMPFASFNPASYCPNPHPDPSDKDYIPVWPPQACLTYCITEDSTARQSCEDACPGLTSTTYDNGTHFPDLIISYNGISTEPRARYCGLAYPKTQRWENPTDPGHYVYYNQTDPFYDYGADGIRFGYSGADNDIHIAYSPAENAGNYYEYTPVKTGTSDLWSGYSGGSSNYLFYPTDSDFALGFHNWGQMMPWYWVGPTWFSGSSYSNSSSPQGYLHVPVGDLTVSSQFNSVYNILNPCVTTDPHDTSDVSGYMSCGQSDKNTCSYIINAGNTPTAGTLNTAFNYFKGQYSGQSSPIGSVCQKNYIIYVTDGLPSTKLDGSTADVSQLMPEVLAQLDSLRTSVSKSIDGTSHNFPVKTYVLGVGLTSDAKTNLDQMATHGGTLSAQGHAYFADDPSQLTNALETIMIDLLGRVSAGSAISILSEGQTQNGANMLQGVFYPQKTFGKATLYWPGYLYDYWFYNSATYNNIREDTLHDYILELDQDYALSFVFDAQNGLSIDRMQDTATPPTGNPTQKVDNVGLDSLTPIWEAGKMLWQTSDTARTIYTPGSTDTGLVSFDDTSGTTSFMTTLSSLLGTPSAFDACLQGSSDTVTRQNLINYVRGVDIANSYCSNGPSFNSQVCTRDSDCKTGSYTTCKALPCKSRTVSFCSNGTPCTKNSDCPSGGSCTPNVWKMGDVVYSSPKVQADYKYCSDGSSFSSPAQACSWDIDCTTGSYTHCTKKESLVFVGANDGMLHAFKTGILSTAGLDSSKYETTKLTGIPTSDMGKELWAFIPQNSLPYLRCLAVPPPSSCHLYYNDLSPYLTRMVSNKVTKTVLIGGMRLGGGAISSSSGSYCFSSSGESNGATCTTTSDCTDPSFKSSCATGHYLNAPTDTCSSLSSATMHSTTAALCPEATTCYNPSNCTGLSSYYALDVTDAENPKLLWEFSHPFLGYSYSGPAVIHKWTDWTHLEGDQYYVMFLSGPTNPTDGSSNQNLKVFVLWLDENLAIKSVYYRDLGIQKAFGGRLFTNGLDVNEDGYTDFVVFGYSSGQSGSTTGWTGGLGKIYTGKATTTDPVVTAGEAAMDPQNWDYDVTTYAGLATLPITAKVQSEQCFNTWYLFAGTGRYFFTLDDYKGSSLNSIMGIPFTCNELNQNCTSIASLNDSSTACTNLQAGTLGQAGWANTLNEASGSFLRERLTTDPTVSASNKIYFTTSEPTSDPCGYGGQSRVWGLNCATGGALSDSCNGYGITDTSGTLYLQTSTGAIYQISTFNGKTTAEMPGMPPDNSLPNVLPTTTPNQSGQLIQWIER